MAVKNGSLIFLKLATAVVDGQTDLTYEAVRDILDATTKVSTGRAKEKLAGEIDHNITMEGKYDPLVSTYTFEDLSDAIEDGSAIAWVMGGVETGDLTLSGNAVPSNLQWRGPRNDVSTWSISLAGTGVVSRGTAS